MRHFNVVSFGWLFLSLWSSVAQAQESAAVPQRIAVKARHVLDVRTGTVLDDATILVEGDRIRAVGQGLDVDAGVRVVDLGPATVLPGLIDVHAHLLASLPEVSAGAYAKALLTKSQAYRALEGAANARRTLRAGFTTVRDVGNEGSGYADVALRDAIARGLVEGPRMLVATRGIAAVGQYLPFGVSSDLPDFPHGAQMVSGAEEARRAVREQIGNGADVVPTMGPFVNSVSPPDSPEGDSAAGDGPVAELWRERLGVLRKVVQTAREVGVKVACGYDSAEESFHGTNAREIVALHEAGLSNLEAIRAATLSAAQLLGLEDKVGSLEAGKDADVIAVSEDPLSDIRSLERVVFVMKAGVVVKQELVR